jgi:hypothetical protein
MAFKTVKNEYLKIDSVRKANWFYHYLDLGFNLSAYQFRDTPERKAQAVIEALTFEKRPDGTKTADFVAEMVRTYNYLALMDDEIRWIKKSDKRLVFWLWNFLRENLQQKVQLHLEQLKSEGQLPDVSRAQLPLQYMKNYQYNFNYKASTHTERYDAIINALDTALLGHTRKIEFNSQLRVYWEQLLTSVPKLTWLIRKPAEADRALAHLMKIGKRKGDYPLAVPLRFDLARLSDQVEKSLAIQAILDFFYTDFQNLVHQYMQASTTKMVNVQNQELAARQQILSVVKTLADKMRNAFDERARRDRKENQKSKNLQLTAKAQDMLNILVILKKQKAMAIIQELLRAELDKYMPSVRK